MTMNSAIDMLFEQGMDFTLPNGRFFIPTIKFWNKLKSLGIPSFIDCGTGCGDLLTESRDNGVRMSGCDLHRREGCILSSVHILPAHRMPFNENISALVCRPSHSGWVQDLVPVVLSKGGRFIYVGLYKNLEEDIPNNFSNKVIAEGVGEDGEVMIEIVGCGNEES